MVGDVDVGGVTIPVLGVIWLASLVIVLVSHFTDVAFGFIGLLSWIVFLLGVVLFIIWVVAQLF
ncbi:TPA: hypothetical protein HA251_00845 [Candidatus Woesearchaeota archaeon]|nr:hypothetical protein [Candidatus Woesearchaeota archaeon]